MSSGDGWTICAAGHRHWGLFGAAGLLIIDGGKVILQHRAPWTHEGDSWGIPGGARNSEEDAVQAALREAREEANLDAADVSPIGLYVDDHDGWAYTTVVAHPLRELSPVAANAESVTVQWHDIAEVSTLPLHTGFAAAWQHLYDVPPALYLVVSDKAASDPLVEVLKRNGVAAERLPAGITTGGLARLFPRVVAASGSADGSVIDTENAWNGQVLIASEPADLHRLA
jgi:8-oxo-dGTP diphosphatase